MLTAGSHVDRYELVVPVGEGGMAQVWIARQRGKHGFEKLFALKAIHHRFADDPAFRAMFLDEARIASAIDHPNVAQVFDLGEKDNVLYLVMEYVDGDSLSAILAAIAKRRGEKTATLPPAIALRIVADVLRGLDAAHRLKNSAGELRGVVHRDISPSNILVSVRGDVKVIDFGIAHARDRASSDTGIGSLKGKINYMAPEQALKQPLGPFTDVFGAGSTLYKLLAGRPAYDGGSEANTLALLMSRVAPPPLGEPIPPLVSAIVARATAPDPGDRYASAREMANAIDAAIAEGGYVANLALWVQENLSDRARARREQLSEKKKSEPPPPAPDLPFAETMDLKSVQPDDVEPTKTPGFMDVRALARNARAPAAAAAAAPATAAAGGAVASGTARGEHASKKGDAPPKGETKPKKEGPKRKEFTAAVVGYGDVPKRSRVRLVALIAGVILVLTLIAVVVGPGMVKNTVIARAREVGVELEVGSAAVSLSGVTLRDVKARIPRLPDVRALTIARIEVVGLSGHDVRVTSIDATIDGPIEEVTKKALALVQENRIRIAGTPAEPRRYTIASSRFTWTNAFDEGSRIDAGDIGVDIDSKGAGVEDVKASIARFDIKGKERTFGPWGLAYDRSREYARARLLLDPPLMDGPHVLVVWNRLGSTLLTLNVPRSPFTHLGIRPAELALPTDTNTELEAKVEGEENAQGKVTGTGRIDLWSAKVKGFSGPVDVHIEGSAKGMTGRPLDLEKTTATIGPFVASFVGTLLARSDGFRVDATWKTHPIACEKLAKAEATKLGPIVEAIQDIAQRTGAARVTGTANASGLLRYDTKNPEELGVTWTTKDTCGLSLFGF